MRPLLTCLPRAVLASAFALVLLSGCYHYRINPGGAEQAHSTSESETLYTFFWGIIQAEADDRRRCLDSGVVAVSAKTNVDYVFLSIVTLGMVVPVDIEWHCAAAHAF